MFRLIQARGNDIAWLAARCAHRLVIDRGRWVSAELPDYYDLDGV